MPVCRLLGFAAPRPVTVQGLLGGPQSRVFADMARLHRDGWGTAWRTRRHAIDAAVSATSGLDDPALAAMLGREAAAARIVHLRLATDGMACAPHNTHPFVADGLAFAHNGSITPLGELERLLSPDRRARLVGDTDSERYFAAILSRMDDGASALDATVDVVSRLRAAFPTRSLNALLLTPTELLAVHASESATVPRDAFASSGLTRAELPFQHDDAYYLMRYRRGADRSVAFASSGLDIAGWEPLPGESVAAVDLETLALRIAPLADPTAAREVA